MHTTETRNGASITYPFCTFYNRKYLDFWLYWLLDCNEQVSIRYHSFRHSTVSNNIWCTSCIEMKKTAIKRPRLWDYLNFFYGISCKQAWDMYVTIVYMIFPEVQVNSVDVVSLSRNVFVVSARILYRIFYYLSSPYLSTMLGITSAHYTWGT